MEHCQDFKMINKIFSEAYENVPNGSYVCPKCGWTMTFMVRRHSAVTKAV